MYENHAFTTIADRTNIIPMYIMCMNLLKKIIAKQNKTKGVVQIFRYKIIATSCINLHSINYLKKIAEFRKYLQNLYCWKFKLT